MIARYNFNTVATARRRMHASAMILLFLINNYQHYVSSLSFLSAKSLTGTSTAEKSSVKDRIPHPRCTYYPCNDKNLNRNKLLKYLKTSAIATFISITSTSITTNASNLPTDTG